MDSSSTSASKRPTINTTAMLDHILYALKIFNNSNMINDECELSIAQARPNDRLHRP